MIKNRAFRLWEFWIVFSIIMLLPGCWILDWGEDDEKPGIIEKQWGAQVYYIQGFGPGEPCYLEFEVTITQNGKSKIIPEVKVLSYVNFDNLGLDSIDFEKPLTITVEVTKADGDCGSFKKGAKYGPYTVTMAVNTIDNRKTGKITVRYSIIIKTVQFGPVWLKMGLEFMW